MSAVHRRGIRIFRDCQFGYHPLGPRSWEVRVNSRHPSTNRHSCAVLLALPMNDHNGRPILRQELSACSDDPKCCDQGISYRGSLSQSQFFSCASRSAHRDVQSDDTMSERSLLWKQWALRILANRVRYRMRIEL